MASGVTVNPQCLETFQELKLKKKTKYIIFNLNKDFSEVIVEKTSDNADYETFLADLPETECRWAIYDFEFEKEGAGKRNKIIFLSWCVFVFFSLRLRLHWVCGCMDGWIGRPYVALSLSRRVSHRYFLPVVVDRVPDRA
ncbi:hypothetical protein BDZ97DRAFT_1810564 [Flammula alnicola]|nr:hypothetical protein BDZ97DRAFT_1810564 [Flammula alnicola]